MRKEIAGSARKKILTAEGVGFHTKRNGERRRRQLRGSVYSSEIVQVNVAVKQAGTTKLEELFPKKEKTEVKK